MVRYRTRGTRDWQAGELENISTTGLLFRTGQPLYLDTTIEMQFSLPIELSGENAAEVFCRGSVVRSTESEMRGGTVHIAVRIEHSRFLRPAG
jgi:PilZ domain